jgi:lipopolysaccharide export system protein LptA
MRKAFAALACSAALFGSLPSLATTTLPPADDRNAPLIMENADRFEGYRSRGEYVLSGNVRFRHGELYLETQRAVWQKDRNIILCESGMRVTRKGSLLTADAGTYDKNLGQATAQGNVNMRDSSGDVTAQGQNLVYLRYRHLATLTGNPIVRRFYLKTDSAKGDSAAAKPVPAASAKAPASNAVAAAKPPAPKPGASKGAEQKGVASKGAPDSTAGKPDTLSIQGEILTYNDSSRIAIADGDVRIRREKLTITCKKSEYHGAVDSLYLLGEPQVVVEDNQVNGDIMRIGMHGEEIKSLLVKGSAKARSIEPATDTSAARQSDIFGDSLSLAFKEKSIDSVQVFRNAKGAYFDVDKPDYVNRMSGEYMVLRFNGKQVASANVLGGAKSTYYHFEKRRLKGKNDAQGDTIDFAFKNGKVDEVMVRGAAKGTYFGEKRRKAGAADTAGVKPPFVPGAAMQGANGAAAPDAGTRSAGADSSGTLHPASKQAPKAATPATKSEPAAEKNAPAKRAQPQPNVPWRKK